ncbi:MAG: MerR family transcriptional regulator [Deltaproteobacteria bacterium]|jgi:DNA-binding transcriptional MerR regulator|nr:MerR family transcriptional regulator [Deltaproteobacteria bacterium]
MKDSLGIADASKESCCSARQLRNYEARGYIKPPVRITCGEIRYRRFSKENLKEIKIFKSFVDQGFTLPVASAKTAEILEKEEK